MLDHFIRSYAANEQVIYLRLRRRPPAAAAATGSAATGSATGTAGCFEGNSDLNHPDVGGVTGSCDCDCGLPGIG